LKPIHLRRLDGFSLIELLVVIGIILLLAVLLSPVAARSQAGARSAQCVSQLRNIGAATIMYASNNDGVLPFSQHQRQSWISTLQPFAAGKVCFKCPMDGVKTRTYTYALNDYLTPNPVGALELNFSITTRIPEPSQTVLFAECADSYTNTDHFHFAPANASFRAVEQAVAMRRHAGKANYLCADGHVESLTPENVQERMASPGSRFIHPEPGQ
jgi:prepilin-type N-terminal cleavage/methylation domain-containing protein/prepilin-type processing-associated H-X9-DG protein